MYEFARGPLVWIAFLIFILGGLYRIIWLIRFSKKDKVVHPYMSLKHGLRSLLHWSVPFGAHNMRLRPFFHRGLVSFSHLPCWSHPFLYWATRCSGRSPGESICGASRRVSATL